MNQHTNPEAESIKQELLDYRSRIAALLNTYVLEAIDKQALARIEAIMLGCLPEKREVNVDEPDDEVFNEAIGFNEAIDLTHQAIRGVLHE